MPTAITSGSSQVNLTSNDFFFLDDSETIISSTNGIEFQSGSTDATLFVAGTIYADQRGIFGATGDNITINIADSATIVATSVGVGVSEDNAVVVNHGAVTSLGSIGVNLEFFSNGGTSFVNFGSVTGSNIGTAIQGRGQYVVNHGSIIGETGVHFTDGNSDPNTFINYGTVTGSSIAGGIASYGVEFNAASDGSVVQNFGTITGDTASIFSEDSANVVIKNDGLLVGDVDLGDAADIYHAGAHGIVVGQILTDEGNDTVRGGHDADDIDGGADSDNIHARGGDDTVLGGSGDDMITGGAGDDSIDGGTGSDRIRAGTGDDNILGDSGQDTIFGGAGADSINGGDSRDTIFGEGDDDVILGGGDRDVLIGGKGDDALDAGNGRDTLDGGSGDDTLTGGTGDDVFVFDRKAGDDSITDFTINTDLIDLSAFGIDFAAFTAADAVTLNANTTVIDLDALGGSGSITVEGPNFGGFIEQDFLF